MNFVKYLFLKSSRFYNKKKETYHRYFFYEKIRIKNTTCTIKDCSLNNVVLGEHLVIFDSVVLSEVKIGSFSYVSYQSKIHNACIGKYCSIGPNVQIGLSPHPTRKYVSSYPGFFSDNNSGCSYRFTDKTLFDESIPSTILGNDIWIGSNAIIPGGIKIGNGAIIGAGAVVVKDVPSYAIVGGNPAKLIRYRFTSEYISLLEELSWWDWEIDKIKKYAPFFSDIDTFLNKTI